MCKVAPLSVGFRAAGVLGGIVGRWRNRRDKLLKVHDVGQEGILRSGAFRIDGTGAMWRQLQGGNETGQEGTQFYERSVPYWTGQEEQEGHSGTRSALTSCTRSRENMWMLQVTVDSVQMMVDRMLRPHALNKRSCRENQDELNWKHVKIVLQSTHLQLMSDWVTVSVQKEDQRGHLIDGAGMGGCAAHAQTVLHLRTQDNLIPP